MFIFQISKELLKPNFFKIGIFVISGLVIAVAAVVVLGGRALFREEILVESYFQESVQGLGIGSPLTFRGVLIGHVKEITLTANIYKTPHRYALVRSSLLTEVFQLKGDDRAALREEVEKGLRVRLALMGLTGAYYLDADYVEPGFYEPVPVDWRPEYPYIPSIPSTVTRVSDALNGIMRNLEQINVQGIVGDLEKSLNALSSVLQGVNVEGIGKEAQGLLSEMRQTNELISKVFAKDVEASLTEIETAFRRLNALLSGQERDVEATLNNFRAASQNLREVTENLRRNPSQLFFSQPPARSR
jgi:phospholipid/cholesterol/gamma-HCH transport system substrate-binding protein/paraquat-inducible protein B